MDYVEMAYHIQKEKIAQQKVKEELVAKWKENAKNNNLASEKHLQNIILPLVKKFDGFRTADGRILSTTFTMYDLKECHTSAWIGIFAGIISYACIRYGVIENEYQVSVNHMGNVLWKAKTPLELMEGIAEMVAYIGVEKEWH